MIYDRFQDDTSEEDAPPKPKRKPIPFEKRTNPEHPYCTNWPVGEKKNEDVQ